MSTPILSELERTLHNRYFRTRISGNALNDLFALLRSAALLVEPPPVITPIATHPEDDLIVATAVSARAHYLVTGDKPLQSLQVYRRVNIVDAPTFLAVLSKSPL